ncbi:MAG: InlB B-repeat-containing protein [Fibrobacter sp.]|nr:InlB B-repeat-containing protein [Fibrobacter sp.]
MDKNILTNRFCGVFVCAIMLFVAQAFAAWDGTSTAQPTKEGDYYIIDTEAKLAWYAKNYNSGNAKLTADMDLGGHLWTPIAAGKGGNVYGKIFDGNGHIVKNLYINATELASKNKDYAQNLGFIAVLGGGTVKNLVLDSVNIQASTNAGDITGSTSNQISVGAVVGWLADKVKINNKDVYFTKDDTFVLDCIASGTIQTTGKGQGVGGIVGNAKVGTINNCLSLVEIRTTGSEAYVGGIIGIVKTDVAVESCVYAGPGLTNTGTNGSIGGVVGNVYSGTVSATDSYFEGNLTYDGNPVGGVGKNCGSNCSVTNTSEKVDTTNVENVACALNGTNDDGSCKEEPWSVGQTGLSLNGYGKDGYKIVFNAKGGSFADGKVSKNVFLQKGMTISAAEIGLPTHADSAFAGWSLDSNATEPAADLGSVSAATKVYAVWYPIYTITFSAVPGAFTDGENIKTIHLAKNERITVEGIELPFSYTNNEDVKFFFTGWALTENAPEDDTLHVLPDATKNITLYAVWTQDTTYTVTYNDNGHGKTKVDFVRVEKRQKTQAPVDPEPDAGYVFGGWYKEPSCENTFNFDTTKIEKNWILYAKWDPIQFTITYEMNKIGDKGDNPESYNIETPTITLANPADVEGYNFEGWFYDANFTNKATQVIQGTTGDKTFFAKWTKKTYRIMYLADNNSQGAITDQFKEHGTPITLESAGYFNRKGYVQTGWATVAEGAKVYEFGATYEENAALTLYPSWEIVIYNITYVCDVCTESNPSKPRTYTINNTKNGNYSLYNPSFSSNEYEFVGWFWDEAYTKRTTNIPKGTVGDTVLYGKMLKKYTITYELNGGSKANSRTSYTSETETFALGEATGRENYIFAGWYTNAEFEGDAITQIAKGASGDTTFYAKWIPESVETQYGAITITESNTKVDGEIVTTRAAVIDGNYTGEDAVEITSDIVVNSVTLDRSFNVNKISTLYVPFEIDTANVKNATVYKFKRIVKEDNLWKFKVAKAGKVMPNTPYVVLPSASQVTFDIAKSVTLNTTTEGEETTSGAWEFKGLYNYTKFVMDDENPIYVFANQECSGAKLGEFVMTTEGAWSNPMRAYLVYHKAKALAKSALGDQNSFLLPSELDIEIEDENGVVVQTGKLNTVTGEVRMDRWFDLKGRSLNSKPTAKGTYYKNGKKTIIR